MKHPRVMAQEMYAAGLAGLPIPEDIAALLPELEEPGRLLLLARYEAGKADAIKEA